MSAETVTIDGVDHVLIPNQADWSTEPTLRRRWQTKVAKGITGAEDRAGVRSVPLYTLSWSVTCANESSLARLEARVIAASKSGYAAAPWFGRAMRSQVATAGASTITVQSTPWLPEPGDKVILLGGDVESEPVYEVRTVQSIIGTVLTLTSTLTYTWGPGTPCYRLHAGEFSYRSSEMLHGKAAKFDFSIEGPAKLPDGGSIQLDGYQSVIGGIETYEIKWGPHVQVDGYQTVVAAKETYTSPFTNAVQIDGVQAVIIALES